MKDDSNLNSNYLEDTLNMNSQLNEEIIISEKNQINEEDNSCDLSDTLVYEENE